jgi:tetratricopeptide (TPR) repeat protein
MSARCIFIVSLSILTSCATYSPGRGIPAPVESRDSTPTAVPQAPNTQSIERIENVPIQRRDLPPVESLPERSPAIVNPAPSAPSAPATASSTLLAGVDSAIAEGDLERAAALCERALRINPRDAMFWYRLASIRAQQGRPNEAEGFARRALSFAGNDASLSQQINALLREL